MTKRFHKSKILLKKAKRLVPSSSQTYSKSYKYFVEGAAPAFLERGKGAFVWDIDGNKYTDFISGLGAITIGYCDKRVDNAIARQIKKGLSFSQPTPLEIMLAEKLIDLIPCAEMVRFAKNGSDAAAGAVRLARAYTGRDIVVCCGYHGWQDWYIGCTENERGVPRAVKDLVKTFTYNDIKSLEVVFSENKGNIAAVILEPVQLDLPKGGFLEKVKDITHKNKALLIFDEVVTGFRVSISGAQGYFGIVPDLAAFGKGMGNGLPISVLAGKKDIMKLIDDKTFISMTFGGDAVSLAGAIATIDILKKHKGPEYFWKIGRYFIRSAEALIKEHNLEGIALVKGLPPHCGIVFNDYCNSKSLELLSIFQQRIIQEGFLSIGINNFCLAHTTKDIDNFMYASSLAFEDIKKAVKRRSYKHILRGKLIRPVFTRN